MAFSEPSARCGHVSAKINAKVFIWGGESGTNQRSTSYLDEVYIFDNVRENWHPKKTVGQRPRGFKFCASAQSGSMLYVYGGTDENDVKQGSLHSFNLESFLWTKLSAEVPNGPKKKDSTRMSVHGNKLFLFGGFVTNGDRTETTDEFHQFDLETKMWSPVATTGSKPPPIAEFSFLKVNDSTDIMFGGSTNSDFVGDIDELYTLDHKKMHWTKAPRKPGQPWPGKRKEHAATFITDNNGYMLISGGFSTDNRHYDDMWLLEITSMTWKKVLLPSTGGLKLEYHSVVGVNTTEDVSEVVLFGGAPSNEIIANTTVYTFAFQSSHGGDGEWMLEDVAGVSALGSKKRIQHKRRLIEKDCEKACRRVIEGQMSVDIYIARLNFLGLPRSGKSSTLKRLIGEIVDIVSAKWTKELESTGVAERNQVFIRNVSKCFGFASNSQWTKSDLSGETAILNNFMQQIVKAAADTKTKVKVALTDEPSHSDPIWSENLKETRKLPSESVNQDYTDGTQDDPSEETHTDVPSKDEIFSSFQQAVANEDWDMVKYFLDDTMYLINTDTGGQTEFLELMSRFILGPALNLIFSRLTDSLEDVYKIYATNEKGDSTEEEDSTVKLEDIIFQALASITCMKVPHQPKEENEDAQVPITTSKAMFVGTFRDEVSLKQFMMRDQNLKRKIEQTEFCDKGIVEHASEDHLILALDNKSGGQDEVDMMRKTFEANIKRNFKKIRIPAPWLMLSINMRHTKQRTMSLQQCQEIAGKLGISPKSLRKALWFLHYRVGVLLYYPEVEGFEDIIILDIQLVFEVTTQLIKKTFTFSKVGKAAADNFKQKAQFSLAHIDDATVSNKVDSIPVKKMVRLLEHHKILAKLPEMHTYFMPCILKSASEEDLKNISCSDDIAPLMIRYECGYMPLGIFSTLITALLSQEDDKWQLVEGDIRRNKITFQVGTDCDLVTLISHPTFMEVILFRAPGARQANATVCFDIRATLADTMKEVHSCMKYCSSASFQFGFECPSHPGKEHLCVVKGSRLLCLKDLKKREVLVFEEEKFTTWFYEGTSSGKENSLSTKVLQHIEWKNSSGMMQELRLYQILGPDWEKVADCVGLPPHVTRAIKKNNRDVEDCIRSVTGKWMEDAPRLNDYKCTLNGMCRLLIDIGQGAASKHLRQAIEANFSSLKKNIQPVDQRVISRKRNKEELQIEKAESKDGEIRPPYPKYSKMSSDRCERDREAEEMWQHRERWQSRPDQNLQDHIRGGPREKVEESSLKETHREHRARRKRVASEEMDMEVMEEMMEEVDGPSTTVASVVRLVDRQDKSSTHSDHGDQNDGPFEDEEIVLSVGQQEEFWGELQAQENEEKITLPDEAGEMIKRPRLFDCTSPSPIVGHRIEVATSVCSSSGGSRAVEKGEGLQEAQENRLDFRTIINRSREEKKDGERLSMPTETLKISPVATETPPRKNVKERLGTRVRGVAAPYVPMSTVMGEEEGQDEEGGQQVSLSNWSVDDVCHWLKSHGWEKFVDTFRDNEVDGDCLLTLDNNLLKNDLGITALGHRSRILKQVEALKKEMHST